MFSLWQKTKKTPQPSPPVTSTLSSTLTVQERRTHAGWLVVNHCFQVIHFLSPCKTNVQIFKTLTTTAMRSRVSEFTRHGQRDGLRSCAIAGAWTGSGYGAMVQNAAWESFELTAWSEVYLQRECFYPACSKGMMSIFRHSKSSVCAVQHCINVTNTWRCSQRQLNLENVANINRLYKWHIKLQ